MKKALIVFRDDSPLFKLAINHLTRLHEYLYFYFYPDRGKAYLSNYSHFLESDRSPEEIISMKRHIYASLVFKSAGVLELIFYPIFDERFLSDWQATKDIMSRLHSALSTKERMEFIFSSIRVSSNTFYLLTNDEIRKDLGDRLMDFFHDSSDSWDYLDEAVFQSLSNYFVSPMM